MKTKGFLKSKIFGIPVVVLLLVLVVVGYLWWRRRQQQAASDGGCPSGYIDDGSGNCVPDTTATDTGGSSAYDPGYYGPIGSAIGSNGTPSPGAGGGDTGSGGAGGGGNGTAGSPHPCAGKTGNALKQCRARHGLDVKCAAGQTFVNGKCRATKGSGAGGASSSTKYPCAGKSGNALAACRKAHGLSKSSPAQGGSTLIGKTFFGGGMQAPTLIQGTINSRILGAIHPPKKAK